MSNENYKWVRNPFLPLDIHCIKNLKEEEFIDISNDGNIKVLHWEMPQDEFWIKIQIEYPNFGETTKVILLQFSTTCLCETAFSVLTNLKTRKRERLLVVEEEIRVALSNVRPNIEKICAKNQAQNFALTFKID